MNYSMTPSIGSFGENLKDLGLELKVVEVVVVSVSSVVLAMRGAAALFLRRWWW